jgi:hypothetical protein
MVQSEQNGGNIHPVQSDFYVAKQNHRQCCVTSTTECCFHKKTFAATSSLSTVPANNGNATIRSYRILALYVANSNAFIATCVPGNNTTYRGLHVKWPIFLSDLNEIPILDTFLFYECVVNFSGSRADTCGGADRQDQGNRILSRVSEGARKGNNDDRLMSSKT